VACSVVEWVSEWVNEFIHSWVSEWASVGVRVSEQMPKLAYTERKWVNEFLEFMSEWVSSWVLVGEWVSEWMSDDERSIAELIRSSEWVSECCINGGAERSVAGEWIWVDGLNLPTQLNEFTHWIHEWACECLCWCWCWCGGVEVWRWVMMSGA
jgi:hypothetical protein